MNMFAKHLEMSKDVYTFAKPNAVEYGKGSNLLTNDNRC